MYKLVRNEGWSQAVTLYNLETTSSLELGVANAKLQEVLTKHDVSYPSYPQAWDISIDKSTAEELALLAMRMKKPIRKSQAKPKQKIGVDIDPFDYIFNIN